MKKVAIDIGHARNTGARGCGYDEHAQCAVIAEHLKRKLESFKVQNIHANIVDFPNLSNSGDLAATVNVINAGDYDAVVSLHMDASDNPTAKGAHVCYCSDAGGLLAKEIALRLCPQLPGRAQPTMYRPGLYVLKHTRPVAVLVECGFITNLDDAVWVAQNVERVALSIALGVAAYFEG